jgi:hypothetical protein
VRASGLMQEPWRVAGGGLLADESSPLGEAVVREEPNPGRCDRPRKTNPFAAREVLRDDIGAHAVAVSQADPLTRRHPGGSRQIGRASCRDRVSDIV